MTELKKSKNDFSPFDLSRAADYQEWRARKLQDYPRSVAQITVPVVNPARLAGEEMQRLTDILSKTNLVVYQTTGEATTQTPTESSAISPVDLVRSLGQQLGLNRLDDNLCADSGISAIRVHADNTVQEGYIPYTNKALSWHTDGYYNTLENSIRAIIMHCENSAENGGANSFLDHEIMYILLRDENPQWIRALMQEDAVTIPPNVSNGEIIRPAQTGPVFFVDANGALTMRYSARQRNIEWKQDNLVQQAVARINQILQEDSEYHFRYQPRPGSGIISNNCLHNRENFVDNAQRDKVRCVYRARYYDRVQNTW